MSTDTKTTTKAVAKTKATKGTVTPGMYAHIIRNVHITEKATDSAAKGGYVFDVDTRATKPEIIKAVKEVYGATVNKVTITQIPAKTKTTRGRVGVRSGGKKATVWLKKGETIEIV